MATQKNNNKEKDMAVKIPSQAEIEQFMYDIDMLEGYTYNEWLDYMEEEYPNVDAPALYQSSGENIITGYRDINGRFVRGEKPIIDEDILAMIQESVDNRPSELDIMNANIADSATELDNMSQAEKSANFMAMLKDKAENPEAYETIMMEQPEVEQFTQGALDDDTGTFLSLNREEMEALNDTPIAPLDPMGIGEMIAKYSTDAGLPTEVGMLLAAGLTKNPKSLVKPKSKVLKKKDGMISTKNSTILKSKSDKDALADRISTKAKGPTVKVNQPVSTANSTILRPTSPATVSAKNSRVLKQTEPKVSTKNSRVIKEKNSGNVDVVTKQANAAKVKSIANTRRSLSTKDKLIASGITSAAAIAALTNKNGLSGDRDEDGSLKPITPVEVIKPKVETKAKSKAIGSYYDDMPPNEKATDNRDIESKSTGRKGWKLPQEFEGSTTTGNYLSADFDDDYWNTPEGVAEAIGIWGRPVGNKRKAIN
jgi:hypothetical protein